MRRLVQWPDFAAALVVLALGVGFLAWARTYPSKPAAVPTLVAWIAIVLSLIDALARTETPLGRTLRRFVAAEHLIEWSAEGERAAGTARIAGAIFWVLAYLAAVAAFGFLAATPAYIFLYLKTHGGRALVPSALAAILTTAAVWATFQGLFRYPLYPGLLFGGY